MEDIKFKPMGYHDKSMENSRNLIIKQMLYLLQQIFNIMLNWQKQFVANGCVISIIISNQREIRDQI